MKKILIKLLTKENSDLKKEIEALSKEIETLNEEIGNLKEKKTAVFKISGKDLTAVLEQSKNKPTPPEFPQDRTGYTV